MYLRFTCVRGATSGARARVPGQTWAQNAHLGFLYSVSVR
jgi:hypothetical protein